jgi:hypothetical protein
MPQEFIKADSRELTRFNARGLDRGGLDERKEIGDGE